MNRSSAGYYGTVTTEARGRRRNAYPEFLCPQIALLRHAFTNGLSPGDWAHMHRPMTVPYEESEERQRRREYSEILQRLPYSDVTAECDPDDESAYPARILYWQYEQGLLTVGVKSGDKSQPNFFKPPKSVIEWRSEYARQLAIYLVARRAKKSEEYLAEALPEI